MKKDKVERICITYPPFENNEGFPLMSLNEQFQWLRNPFLYLSYSSRLCGDFA